MKKIVVAIPMSHGWFWVQTCLASLCANPPKADGCEVDVVVINNSPWSPAALGVTDTELTTPLYAQDVVVTVMDNYKSNRFHASALDCVVERADFDLLMAWETDVLALRPDWLGWFLSQMRETDFAVGMAHHEAFLNPSCTLYRGDVLREMAAWCKVEAPQDELRWGEDFQLTAPLDNNLHNAENPAAVLENMKDWIGGPFAEKRGFHPGTKMAYPWSGQKKGGGWFEPSQQLFHWATNAGHTFTFCPTHTHSKQPGLPVQTIYGDRVKAECLDRECNYFELRESGAYTCHMWGGTRALDILKHPVTCEFVRGNTPYWLEREARFWLDAVPADVRAATLDLIRTHGWHYRGQGTPDVTDRDREAAAFVRDMYAKGGVTW